jgi:hypothetical protein
MKTSTSDHYGKALAGVHSAGSEKAPPKISISDGHLLTPENASPIDMMIIREAQFPPVKSGYRRASWL